MKQNNGSKLNILQVCQYFYPYLAGQEMFVLQLGKKLKKSGHNVTVCTSNHSQLQVHEKIEGIEVFRFKMLFNPLNNPVCPGFINIYKKIRCSDIIHVHNEHSFVTFITCMVNRFYNKPLVLTCHGQLRFNNYLKDQFEMIYSRTVGRFILNNAAKIVALSDSDKDYIISIGISPEKIIVVPNAIDLEYLENIPDDNVLKEKECNILLYVGVLIKRKGVEYLIRSLPYIIKKKRVRCIIIGKGDYREKLEALAAKLGVADIIDFKGSVKTEELHHCYNISDVFILPSVSEGLPTSILEAMYFGLPVVSTDIPGIRDHFRHFAILVRPRDEMEIAEAIDRLLNEEELREMMARHGKELVKEKYNWNKVSNTYIDIYKELLKNTS